MAYKDEVDGDSVKTQWIKLVSKTKNEETKKEENVIYQEFLQDVEYRKGIQQ